MSGLGFNCGGGRLCRRGRCAATAALALLLFLQPGCLFKKKPKAETPQTQQAPIRLAALPLNVSQAEGDARWAALAVPAMITKAAQLAKDLEMAPLWESMPVAVESAGDSRFINTEVAAYVASRVSAKWGVAGEITASKGGIALQIEFIPVKANNFAFRYSRETTVDAIPAECYEAITEFLRYQVARPPAKWDAGRDSGSLKQIAQTIDQEYGWFVPASAGTSEAVVSGLSQGSNQLARLLFNPTVYRTLGGPPPQAVPPAPTAAASRKTVPPPAETAAPAIPRPQTESQPATEPTPEAAEFQKFTPPPPQTFSQMLPALQATAAKPVESASDASGKQSGKKSAGRPKPEPKGVRIQVFASQSRKEAEDMAAKLTSWGYVAGIEEVDLADKGTWYRIRLQPFPTRQEATSAGEKMLAEGLVKGYWVVP